MIKNTKKEVNIPDCLFKISTGKEKHSKLNSKSRIFFNVFKVG